MEILTNLTAERTSAADAPIRDVRSVVAVEPIPGFIIQLRLGATGLLIYQGESKVFIPTEALIALAGIEPPTVRDVVKALAEQSPTP